MASHAAWSILRSQRLWNDGKAIQYDVRAICGNLPPLLPITMATVTRHQVSILQSLLTGLDVSNGPCRANTLSPENQFRTRAKGPRPLHSLFPERKIRTERQWWRTYASRVAVRKEGAEMRSGGC